ncbi:hypothetical protein QTN25_008640 [Entamoeba marina]
MKGEKDTTKNNSQLDSYSILICSKYFIYSQDFINIMCVCKNFKETTEKLRYNPISITSLELFPKIQTQYLYDENNKKIEGIERYEFWGKVNYKYYLQHNGENIKFHYIKYTKQDRKEYGNNIPKEVNILDDMCYGSYSNGSNIKSIALSNNIIAIGKDCFSCCYNLESINLSTKIKSLQNNCFTHCSLLTSITFPQSSLKSIGYQCFSSCSSIKTIEIPNSVTSIGVGCFDGCTSLQSIKLPNNIVTLKVNTFSYCKSLNNITLPESLCTIGSYCFSCCINLSSITLPSSLTKLGSYSFVNCTTLTSVFNNSKHIEMEEYCFRNCNELKIKP